MIKSTRYNCSHLIFYCCYEHNAGGEGKKWAYSCTSFLQGDDGSNGLRGTAGEKGFKVMPCSFCRKWAAEIDYVIYIYMHEMINEDVKLVVGRYAILFTKLYCVVK